MGLFGALALGATSGAGEAVQKAHDPIQLRRDQSRFCI